VIIITQIKNENLRIKEWIEHHSWLGVSEFIIFDDYSTDNTLNILNKLKKNINIQIHFTDNVIFNYTQRQVNSINIGLNITKQYKQEIPLLIFDVDEFLVTDLNKNIMNILEQNFLNTKYQNYYLSSYDVQPIFDLNMPNITLQTTKRWSEYDRKTKQNGYWKERGKSITTNKRCSIIKNIHALHDFDESTGIGHAYNLSLLAKEQDMRLHHFRLPPNGYNEMNGSDHFFREFNEDDKSLFNMTKKRLNINS